MKSTIIKTFVTALALFAVLGAWSKARSEDTKTKYPGMAPLERYLMADRNAEIALAQSAAPPAISGDAEVMVLGRHGYQTAVKGKNGFVCVVERSWSAGSDDPNFWNPKLRGPICFNPAAARSYLPLTIRKTELVLRGESKTQIAQSIAAGLASKELPAIEPGAMCYMLSRQGYLDDVAGHWHPHLMFFVPLTEPALWGAGPAGSPVVAAKIPEDSLTIFMVPVARWSDGTVDSAAGH